MFRKRKIIAFVLIALCLIAAVGYVIYSRTVMDYVSCARMLSKTYNSDCSDLTFYVTIDTAGQEIDAQFRAIRFPYQSSTATQVTVIGKNGDYTFYKVNGRSLSSEESDEAQNGIPRNFMELIEWGKRIYESDLTIQKTRDRGASTYTVTVPDEMVQSFMEAYLGKLESFDLRYHNCKLSLTGTHGNMSDLILTGTAEYRVLFVNTSTDILVRAHVNALGNQVQIPDVPDYVVKAAS